METQSIIVGSAVMIVLLFIPGYSLVRGLFSRKEIGVLWTICLSFLFGLVSPLILYILNKNINVPINSQTSMLTAVFVTCVGAVLWWGRQNK